MRNSRRSFFVGNDGQRAREADADRLRNAECGRRRRHSAIGPWFSRKAGLLAARMLGRQRYFDPRVKSLVSNLVLYSALIVTGLAVLSEFDVRAMSTIAIFGIAGLAVGLGLQGVPSN
jgi:small-conductance mechanosensitive channel